MGLERPALLGIAFEADVGPERRQHQRAHAERGGVEALPRPGPDVDRPLDEVAGSVVGVGEVRQRRTDLTRRRWRPALVRALREILEGARAPEAGAGLEDPVDRAIVAVVLANV
ncbi:hypothetical protein [Actinoallomurus sp. NPDC052274]|uniref:hypothetical protein n=1 Tax=Actinoallomurus sp. NPDC052274 TaxID=3155420 RepID=UPI00341CEBDD